MAVVNNKIADHSEAVGRIGVGPALWALQSTMVEAILGHGLTAITNETLACASSL